MFRVVATRIREIQPRFLRSAGHALANPDGKTYHGYTLMEPRVGNGFVLYRDRDGRRMVTTAIRRVLRTDHAEVVYIETENSVYRLYMESSSPDRLMLEMAAT